MRYEILFTRAAHADMKDLSAFHRSTIKSAIEQHLRHQPRRTSRSRIKRLEGMREPQYRLRVADHRVFYSVDRQQVVVHAIVSKAKAQRWLDEERHHNGQGSTS